MTGIPTSPSDDCEHYEIHINADIALALRQLVYATGKGTDDIVELSKGLAEYWVSRLTKREDGKFGILGGWVDPLDLIKLGAIRM